MSKDNLTLEEYVKIGSKQGICRELKKGVNIHREQEHPVRKLCGDYFYVTKNYYVILALDLGYEDIVQCLKGKGAKAYKYSRDDVSWFI